MSTINRLNGVTSADIALVDGKSASAISRINGQALLTSSLLLDLYGTDAVAAYSIRKLSSSYTGNAIRVRESQFNTETDIGFDSNGELDTTALLAHCSFPGASGFITKWYDQTGNSRDAIQTGASLQFKIVNSNSLITINGKPAIEGTSTANVMTIAAIPAISQPLATFEVYSQTSMPATSIVGIFKGSNSSGKGGEVIVTRIASQSGVRSLQTFSDTGSVNQVTYATTFPNDALLHVNTRIIDTTSSIFRVDGSNLSYPAGDDPVNASIGGAGAEELGGSNVLGKLCEFVLYDSDKAADMTNIEDNMQTYYSTP